MKQAFYIRAIIFLGLWLPVAILSFRYSLVERDATRFDFMLSSSGVVSTIQQETWSGYREGIQPNDRILKINGFAFDYRTVKRWLSHQEPGQKVSLLIERNRREINLNVTLKRYSKNAFLLLFTMPAILSIIFLIFALGVSLQPAAFRRRREAMEVFSALCFLASLIFVSFLPTVSLGLPYSFSIFMPIFGFLIAHLFSVYPKKKFETWLRLSLFAGAYLGSAALAIARIALWHRREWAWIHGLNLPILGICGLIALFAIGNTVLASKDFWARRRARLLSLVFLFSFIGALSVFVAYVWESPRLSWERILALSLIFPTAFSVIFLKSNVFNLERIFRRGLHQLLLVLMSVSLALLVGLGWSQWQLAPDNDWMLWAAIAIVVVAIGRPVGVWFENTIHRVIQTRVRYPMVHSLFESSKSLEDFLRQLGEYCESQLRFERLCIRCFQDPTNPWSSANEQRWEYSGGKIQRLSDSSKTCVYQFSMTRGDFAIGEISMDGSDGLAFDPHHSMEWAECVRSISRCIELLCLRDFISIQQGFLAVGRMQSLLAHEMKNPLAIIKVCSGLLSGHMHGDEEAEELLKTIQDEVRRVSAGIQRVFDQSAQTGQKTRVNLAQILEEVSQNALQRFPNRSIETSVYKDGQKQDSKEALFWLWMDREGLLQALRNLVINAFEASASRVEIEVHQTDRQLSLVVRDNGAGIPEELDLFKPFMTTKPQGTGLGLTNVKAFVDQNGGQIRVQSKKREGTTFILDFSKQFVMNGEV